MSLPSSTNTSSSNNKLYTPTPMEEAYAVYLLQQVFSSSYELYQTSGNNIHIPGQPAVAFLTTSHIHRLILRNIWTVADPDNEGTLLSIHQWHVVLRLVALSQAGHVEQELLSVGRMPPPKPTPTQVLVGILNKTAGQVVPLAQFDTVAMPSQQTLQQMYQHDILGNNNNNSVLAAPDMDMAQRAKSVSPQPAATGWQPQPPPPARGHSLSPPPTSFTQPVQPQGMAAFDDLVGGMEDQPLPSLTTSSASNDNNNNNNNMASTALGGLENATTTAINSSSNNNNNTNDPFGGFSNTHATAVEPGMAALDVFGNNNNNNNNTFQGDAPLPAALGGGSLGQPQANTTTINNDNDEFGGFSNATQAEPTGMAALDAFGSVADAPLPALGGAGGAGGGFGGQPNTTTASEITNNNNDDEDEDEFGGFSDAAPASEHQQPPPSSDPFGGFSPQGAGFTSTTTPESLAEPTGFGALDALGPIQNAPLATLDTFGQPQQQQQQQQQQNNNVLTESNNNNDNNDNDDDFGGFAGADAPAPAPTGDNHDFGGFANASATPTPAPDVVSGFDALDALGPVDNAPLAPLGSFGQPAQQEEDDEFGGFSDAPPAAAAPIADVQAPMGEDNNPTNVFGGFAGTDTTSSQPQTNNTPEDDFGGFSEAATQQTQEVSGFDALDALGPVDNAPLPALGSFGQPPQEQLPADDDDFTGFSSAAAPVSALAPESGNDDDFGGFSTAAPQESQPDAFSGFSDAAPPQQEEAQQGGSDFGAFSNVSEQQQQHQPTPDADDPFGALAGVQDAPLPNLGMGQPQSERGLGVSTSPAPQPSIQPSLSFPGTGSNDYTTSDTNTGNIFGAFDGLAGAQDAPFPSVSSGENFGGFSDADTKTMEDSFGSFNAGPPKSMEDSFGSFTAADEGQHPGQHRRQSSGGSHHKRKSGSASSYTETVPKDLRPSLPGSHYGRTPSMRSLPETDLDDDTDAEDNDDPFAVLDDADENKTTKPLELHEPASLGLGAETLPQDLRPPPSGQHYVPHSPHAKATPGGLLTLPEPAAEEEEEDGFGGFEGGPTTAPFSKPNTTDHFNASMPHELQPHPPGHHYVHHEHHASQTPGGLSTVGEMPVPPLGAMSEEWNSDLSHLNPPAGLSKQDSAYPSELHPHEPGKHYVQHSSKDGHTPGGLSTVEDGDDDEFGDFSGGEAAATPPELNRQATPAAQDLQPERLQMNAPTFASVNEDEEDEEGFGGFADASEGVPPPSGLSRQATPAPSDLEMPKEKASFGGASSGDVIEEGDEDDFGDFAAASAPGQMEIPGPSQMRRQATPMPQELRPDLTGMKTPPTEPGLGSISEAFSESDEHAVFGRQHQRSPKTTGNRKLSLIGDDADDEQGMASAAEKVAEEDDGFGDFTAPGSTSDMPEAGMPNVPPPAQLSRQATPALGENPLPPSKKVASGGTLGATAIQEGEEGDNESESTKSDDPFSAFDTLAPPQGDLPPLSSFKVEEPDSIPEGDAAAPPQLSRQPTPAAQDLDPITRKMPNNTGIGSATIPEGGEEEDDDFGDFFTSAEKESSHPSAGQAADLLQTGTFTEQREQGDNDWFSFQTPPAPDEKQGLDVSSLHKGDLLTDNPGNTPHNTLGSRSTSNLLDDSSSRNEEEDFGSFSGVGEPEGVPAPSELIRKATPAAKDLEPIRQKPSAPDSSTIHEEGGDEDDFGGFKEAAEGEPEVPKPAQLSRQATPAPGDLASPTQKPASAGSLGGAVIEEEEEEDAEDDFGDFGQSGGPGQMEIPAPTQIKRQATPMPHDLRPDLAGRKSQEQPGLGSIGENDGEEDVDFGDFGSFEEAQQQLRQSASGDSNNDSFGDFAAFASAPADIDVANAATDVAGADDSFGDFAAFTPVPAPVPAPAPVPIPASAPTPVDASNDDSFGDFAAFQEAPAGEGSDVTQLRGEILSLSMKLPDSFREALDLGKHYDDLVKGKSSLTEGQNKRIQRCVQVLSLLTSSHAKLASAYWTQVMGVAGDELSRGKDILEEAVGFSSEEKEMVRKQLETFVAGLGEFVRAIRFIIASLGDMLLLDLSAPLDNAPQWSPSSLVKQVLKLENLWSEVLDKATYLGLQSMPHLESIMEIRTRCLGLCPSNALCHLTLQPLSDTEKQTTKGPVDWGGKKYMACSANFLVNKCPFYVND